MTRAATVDTQNSDTCNYFTSTKSYLAFFQNIKSQSLSLKKGKMPNMEVESSTWASYFFIIILGVISFVFFNGFLILVTSALEDLPLLSFLTVPIFLIGYSFFFGTIFIFVKQTQFSFQEKVTTFKQVRNHYLHKLACFSRVPILKARYPYVPPFNEKPKEPDPEEETKQILPTNVTASDFLLFIGTSTGLMSSLWHTSALAKDQNVFLDTNDAAKNILVFGGIGSGKTSTIMQPLMLQLMAQGCGGLIFDIKGDVKNTALNFSKNTNRHIRILGPVQSKFNLLCMIPPEVASSFLKSAFLLHSGDSTDRFWVDTATELSRNVLGLLSFIPKYYTLKDLYQ